MSRGEVAGKRRRKKAQNKVNLVFDATKRKEFLSGFQKRNQDKRKKAQEELIQKMKDEKKRIKQEAKESYKKLVVTRRNIPELEELFSNEFETEEASVKIVELSTEANSESSQWIGQNRLPQVEDEPSEAEESEVDEEEDELPGMELKQRRIKNDDIEMEEGESSYNGMSKKEINKLIKNEATQKIQKSKAYRKKNKVEQIKNKKKSMLMAKEKKKCNKKNVKSNRTKKSNGKRKR